MSVSRSKLTGSVIAATHNPGKFRELAALITPYGVALESARDHKIPEPEETGSSFAANAALKARHVAHLAGRPALADDSGLCVEALFGDPGIFSARWAGPDKDFALAIKRVEAALQTIQATDLSACFVCALCLAWPDGTACVFEGEVRGQLVFPGRGSKGFGYDPIFIADGYRQTFGEMDPSAKHSLSHRAEAFAKLTAALL